MSHFHKDLVVDFERMLEGYEELEPREELLQDLERSFQTYGKGFSG